MINPLTSKYEVVGFKTEYKPKQVIDVGLVSDRYCMQRTSDGRPILVPFIDRRGVKYVAALALERIHHGYDCIILYSGQRRTGKSTLAQQIAISINRNLSTDCVYFKYEDMRKGIDEAPYADPKKGIIPQLILDEAAYDLFAKDFMGGMQKDAVKVLQVVGAKNLIIHMIMPHKDKLLKDIRDEMGYMWLDTNPKGKFQMERGYAELRIGRVNKFHQLEYWQPKCGFMFGPMRGKFWDDYTAKKEAFIKNIFKEPAVVEYESPMREQKRRVIKGLYRKGWSQEEIGDLYGISHQAVSKIVNYSSS